ncbi:MAG: hypothetical protein KAI66_27515, partial [Lentisphaeria bacterium]|nr:hypothetical protein [Lentisphaeria bacterium]
MSHLVTTLGGTWAIVPELLAFTNPEDVPLFAAHPQRNEFARWRAEGNIPPVQNVWAITSDSSTTRKSLIQLRAWLEQTCPGIRLRVFVSSGISALADARECRRMTDLVLRVVLHAHAEAGEDGAVVLSLAGGRKTMSADMQAAGRFLGCRAMLHVVNADTVPDDLRQPTPERLVAALEPEEAALFSPIIVSAQCARDFVMRAGDPVRPEDFPLSADEAQPSQIDLADEIRTRHQDASSLLVNYVRQTAEGTPTNFRVLYALPPDIIDQLRSTRIGCDPACRENELAWLRALPKAELHCHLGGILSPGDMVEVALVHSDEARTLAAEHAEFANWLERIRALVSQHDAAALRQEMGGAGKALRQKFATIPEPLAVCAFLSCFQTAVSLLDEVVFGELRSPGAFCGIGIDRYEKLGDLQGSGLLQSEPTLRAACQVLGRQCEENNIRYLELRCSPLNCTRGDLSPERVVDVLLDETARFPHCHVRLLFIASRHGKMSDVHHSIELAQSLLDTEECFAERFAGFDLAGNESARSAAQLREAFLPLMERCLRLTIHAGETETAASVWEAVYHLSADRVGHGLTLGENPDLLRR